MTTIGGRQSLNILRCLYYEEPWVTTRQKMEYERKKRTEHQTILLGCINKLQLLGLLLNPQLQLLITTTTTTTTATATITTTFGFCLTSLFWS